MSRGVLLVPALIAGHSLRAEAMLAGGMLVVAVPLALLMSRHPRLFPLLAVIALPFRLPIAITGRTVNLLIPLYIVIGAGILAHLAPRLLGRQTAYRSGRPPMALDWLLGASVVLYALQMSYSTDAGKAAQNIVFFYVPFALLYVLLREAPWTGRLVLQCFAAAVGLAVIFAGAGFIEYERKALLLNPKVVAANQFDNYFRVNSLFFDPNIYGRFLALVMLAVTTVVLWTRRRREVWIGAGVLLWLEGGLITSFSQTSIAALLAGLAALAALRWSVRRTIYVIAALLLVAAIVVFASPKSLHLRPGGTGGFANSATSGRTKLISGGLHLFAERPLQGYGSGSFETEYKLHRGTSTQNAATASHTIPVTVAAEQGIVGLVLYVALLVVAFTTLLASAGRSPPRIAIAVCFVALVLHTWSYADFLEDPITWTLLGMGVALRTMRGRALGGDDVASRSETRPPSPVTTAG